MSEPSTKLSMQTVAAILASLLAALLFTSCATTPAATPQNFLRVKGGETPTDGYQVMRKLDEVAPTLEPFLKKQGDPEFLFITEDEDKTYLFLYYVSRNQAYAVRGPKGAEGIVEFSGPQKIDPKERALFKALIDLEPES